jgi:hypothetical protein
VSDGLVSGDDGLALNFAAGLDLDAHVDALGQPDGLEPPPLEGPGCLVGPGGDHGQVDDAPSAFR